MPSLPQMWTAGLPIDQIAKALGISPAAVYKRAAKRGLGPKVHAPRRRAKYSDLEALWLSSATVLEIARAKGVCPSAVTQAAKRRGFPSKHHVRAAA